jgi:hypothetical protein
MWIRKAEGQQLYLTAGLAPPATLVHSYAPSTPRPFPLLPAFCIYSLKARTLLTFSQASASSQAPMTKPSVSGTSTPAR